MSKNGQHKDLMPNEKGKQKEKDPTDVSMGEFYKYYRSRYVGNVGKNEKDPYDISQKKYGKIIRDFNQNMADRMIYKAEDVKLPCRLGYLGIRKAKRKTVIDKNGRVIRGMPVDWKKTRELWRDNPRAREKGVYIRYKNEHSDEYVARFKYFKDHAIYPNKTLYKFKISRTNARELSRIMKDPMKYKGVDYYVHNGRK